MKINTKLYYKSAEFKKGSLRRRKQKFSQHSAACMFPDHHQQQCCAGGGGGEVFKVNRQEAYIVVVAACTAYTHSFIIPKAFGQSVKSRHVNVLNIYVHLMPNQVQG